RALGLLHRSEPEGARDDHLPGEHRTRLQRDPARPRLAPADRQVPGGDPGQLEAGGRLRDRAVAHRPRGAEEEVPQGLQGAEARSAADAAAASLSLRRGREGGVPPLHARNAATTRISPATSVPSAPTTPSGE